MATLRDLMNNFQGGRRTRQGRNARSEFLDQTRTGQAPGAATEPPNAKETLRSAARKVTGNPVYRGASRITRAVPKMAIPAAALGAGMYALEQFADGGETPTTAAADPNMRTGRDGTPLPNPQQASNPNTVITDRGFATPVGEGASLPFGRTPELQAQIDANVAAINERGAAERANTSLRRALQDGTAVGTDTRGTPEQQEIRRLVGQLRSGNIGDKQRNNVLLQQIAALQGVDTTNVSRETNLNTARQAMLDRQLELAKLGNEASKAEREELQYLSENLDNPDTQRSLRDYLSGAQAGGVLSPSQRSALKRTAGDQANSRLPSIGAFFDTEDIDPTNPSFAGTQRITGGGAIGDFFGFGPGFKMPDGTVLRDDNLDTLTRQLLNEALRRDNPAQ